MNTRLFVLFGVFMSNVAYAQDLKVKKFEPQAKDHTAVSMINDNNGNPCALLLVQSLKEGLEFEGWVVGDVERKDDVYWVYIANGAKHIKIKHSDYQTKVVIFSDYGISTVKGGVTYTLQLVDDTKDIVNKVYRLGWNLKGMKVPNAVKTYLNMAATRGEIKAIKAMAQLPFEGETDDDLDPGIKKFHWIEKLLEKGDSSCLDSMPGKLMFWYVYDYQPRYGKSSETEKEIYYLKACLKGYKPAGDYFFSIYPDIKGLPEYRTQIINLCLDSASVGNKNAMKCLGYIYEKGISEDVNLIEAAKWFKKAYERDSSYMSKTNLCRVYGNKAFPIDERSLDFIKKQSGAGLTEALFQMGCMYEEGRNFSMDIEKAIDYYKQATPTYGDRHSGAAYRLAKIYYDRNDIVQAKGLLRTTLLGTTDDKNLDARYLLAVICFYHPDTVNTANDEKIWAYNVLSDLSKKGYQKATEFIKNNY